MIPLPTLPTDNLYKFLVVVGLVLYVTGSIYEATTARDHTKRIAELLKDMTVVGKELEFLAEDRKDLTDELVRLKAEKRPISPRELKEIQQRGAGAHGDRTKRNAQSDRAARC